MPVTRHYLSRSDDSNSYVYETRIVTLTPVDDRWQRVFLANEQVLTWS